MCWKDSKMCVTLEISKLFIIVTFPNGVKTVSYHLHIVRFFLYLMFFDDTPLMFLLFLFVTAKISAAKTKRYEEIG